MKQTWLIYHPKRQITVLGKMTVHHDNFGGNEDPYIWHDNFLHTYCHITQLTNNPGQINFWISGDIYPNFSKLYCDCVFVIKEKCYWKDRNSIDCSDSIVDNKQTYEHHYKWAENGHHVYKKRRRYTLKADSKKSFQPQDNNGNLIDILPFLNCHGIDTKTLINSMTSKKGSRPFQLDNGIGKRLYDYLYKTATTKLYGKNLKDKHPNKLIDKNGHC